MIEANLDFEIDVTRRRIEELRRASKAVPVSEVGLLQEVFYELNESLEELSIAEEELSVQTEHLRSSREVIEAERIRYQQLFDLAPDGYIVTDRNGVIQEANSAAHLMFGQKARYLVGKPLPMFVAQGERKGFRDRLSELRSGNRITDWEVTLQPPGGQQALDVSLTVGYDGDKRISGNVIRWIMRDVSDRKRDRSELVTLNRELEQKVQERTRDLEEAYQHERRIANVLEEALLHTPAVEHDALAIETYSEAALDEAGVGGDFCDVFCLERADSEGQPCKFMALVVGDVSGKGLNAAVCAASVKYTLRGLIRREASPAEAFARLNEFVCTSKKHGDWSPTDKASGKAEVELFVVVAVAIIDCANGNCEIITAGTEPLVIIRPDGTSIEISSRSIALGIQDGSRCTTASYTLSQGDVIAMSTDGITEARRNGSFFGTDGIAASLKERDGRDLKYRVSNLVSDARDHSGGVFRDDVCVVVAERR